MQVNVKIGCLSNYMKIINKTVSEIINTEYREYAMYVLESRAIPSAIDGLKMVTRKLLYAMLTDHNGKKTKVADLSGISKNNYHHGESSAAAAAITITAEWNNNCPIFTGHGSFGSRMVTSAAAPRYIFSSLSENYNKIFCDLEVAPKSFDPENPEPAFYLPIIPWVLINGVSGLAVGFKSDILPHSVSDIITATKACLKNPKAFLEENKPIDPSFPHFNGTVVKHTENQWKTQGKIQFIGKNFFQITELPIGWDREGYVTFLNELVDKDMIKDYEDECSKSGFGFKIKVSIAQRELIERDALKYFKLEKIHTEILTTLGTDGKLKIFQTVPELIHYFCEYRLKKFGDKLEFDKEKLLSDIKFLKDKQKFINAVILDDIQIKDTSKKDLLEFVFNKITEQDYGKAFIRIPLYELTNDAVIELENSVQKLLNEYDQILKLTPEKVFMQKLNSLKF